MTVKIAPNFTANLVFYEGIKDCKNVKIMSKNDNSRLQKK